MLQCETCACLEEAAPTCSATTRTLFLPCAANERTFLHWLNVAVTVGSLAAAMLGISGHAHNHWGDDYQRRAVAARVLALLVMLTSICVAIYAAFLYVWRAVALKYASAVNLRIWQGLCCTSSALAIRRLCMQSQFNASKLLASTHSVPVCTYLQHCTTLVPCLQGEVNHRLFQYSSAYHSHHCDDICAPVSVFRSCAVVQSCCRSPACLSKPSLDARHATHVHP